MKRKLASFGVILLLAFVIRSGGMFAPVTMVSAAELPTGGDIKWEITNTGGVGFDDLGRPYCNDSSGMTVTDAFSTPTGTSVEAFDNGATVWVEDQIVSATANTFQLDTEQRIVTVNGGTISGLPVTMTYYAASSRAALRTVAFIGNPGPDPVTPTVSFRTNSGAGTNTGIPPTGAGVTGTSSGDSTFLASDRWLITADTTDEAAAAAVTHVLFGPQDPPVKPVSVSSDLSTGVFTCPRFRDQPPQVGGDFDGGGEHKGVRADYELPVPPGQSRALMFFNESSNAGCTTTCWEDSSTRAGTYDSSELPLDLLVGMTPKDLLSVSNWKFTFDGLFAVGPGQGMSPDVRMFATDPSGTTAAQTDSFLAYNGGHKGGVTVASGDVDGDGIAELITGPGPGGGPHVRVWKIDLATLSVIEPPYAEWYAYSKGFTGGIFVAAGDVDGDNKAEVITGAGAGGGPHVRIFKVDNNNGVAAEDRCDTNFPDGPCTAFGGFYAFPQGFTGGVRVAAGNVINASDNKYEIIAGSGPGIPAAARVFSFTATEPVREILLGNGRSSGEVDPWDGVHPYGDSYSGGLFVASANVVTATVTPPQTVPDDELITSPGPGIPPVLKTYEIQVSGTAVERSSRVAYDFFTGGASIGTGDFDNDPFPEIITGAGPTGGPRIRTWKTDRTTWAISEQLSLPPFYAYDPAFSGGVWVAGLRLGT